MFVLLLSAARKDVFIKETRNFILIARDNYLASELIAELYY